MGGTRIGPGFRVLDGYGGLRRRPDLAHNLHWRARRSERAARRQPRPNPTTGPDLKSVGALQGPTQRAPEPTQRSTGENAGPRCREPNTKNIGALHKEGWAPILIRKSTGPTQECRNRGPGPNPKNGEPTQRTSASAATNKRTAAPSQISKRIGSY